MTKFVPALETYEIDDAYTPHQSDCLLCDREVRLVWFDGVKAHLLDTGEIAHCMQDTHISNRTVN